MGSSTPANGNGFGGGVGRGAGGFAEQGADLLGQVGREGVLGRAGGTPTRAGSVGSSGRRRAGVPLRGRGARTHRRLGHLAVLARTHEPATQQYIDQKFAQNDGTTLGIHSPGRPQS